MRTSSLFRTGGSDYLKVFDNTGKFLYKIGEPGEGDGQLDGPWGLCVQKCSDHHNLLICNAGNGPFQFTVEGCFTGKTVYKLQDAIGITTTPSGLILVTDCKTKKIHILKSNIVAPDWKTKQNIHAEICTKKENSE